MPVKNTIALETLLSAPLRSIGVAQQTLEHCNIEHIVALMQPGDNGIHVPRTIDFILTYPNQETKQVSIPVISLVTLPQLLIDDVDIRLNAGVRYTSTGEKRARQRQGAKTKDNPTPISFLCTLLPQDLKSRGRRDPSLSISLRVQRNDPSEAVRTLQDRLLESAERGKR